MSRSDRLRDSCLATIENWRYACSCAASAGLGQYAPCIFPDPRLPAVRREQQQAILTRREAIDSGWRDYWWRLRFPAYDRLREDPEWIGLTNEIEADNADQRQWYEERKDDPKF